MRTSCVLLFAAAAAAFPPPAVQWSGINIVEESTDSPAQCIKDHCHSESVKCELDHTCKDFINCEKGCTPDDKACAKGCESKHMDSKNVKDLLDCAAQHHCVKGTVKVAAGITLDSPGGFRSWHDDGTTLYMPDGGDTHSMHAAAAAATSQTVCSSQKKSSMITGGKVVGSFTVPNPTLAMAVKLCCGIANGNWYTNVDVGPSKKYKDQRNYICTVYQQSGSAAPGIVPGNSSTTAGLSAKPPGPDPKCAQKKTKIQCLNGLKPYHAGVTSACAWTGDQCSYSPPLQCGNFGPKQPYGPFCVGIDLSAMPFPIGKAGRTLRSFNWTSGTVGPQQEKVFVQPAQVLQLGNTTWFSVSVDPASGFSVCATYNELSEDGRSSDPNTGFSACANYGAGAIGLKKGSSKNVATYVAFGESAGWTEKGYDPSAGTALWGYFMFWSNTTSI